MSRTLARIRETTGDPIFVQSGRALVPTPRALQLREQIQDALQQASGVLAPGEQVDLKRLDTRFNVRANDIFTGIYAGRLLDALQNDMPRATLRFMPEEDDVDDEMLRAGRVDLFISASRQLGHEIRVQPLFTTRMVGVACADHPLDVYKRQVQAHQPVRLRQPPGHPRVAHAADLGRHPASFLTGIARRRGKSARRGRRARPQCDAPVFTGTCACPTSRAAATPPPRGRPKPSWRPGTPRRACRRCRRSSARWRAGGRRSGTARC